MLEAVAFQSHPETVATFGDDGAAVADLLGRRQPSGGRRVMTWIVGVLAVLGFLAPISGVAAIGADSYLIEGFPASVSVPIAMVSFTFAATAQLIAIVVWWRAGAYWSGMLCGIGVVSAICAGLALISIPNVARHDDYELPPFALGTVWATMITSILLIVLVVLRFRIRVSEPTDADPRTVPTITAAHTAEQAVRALPADERNVMVADRDAALRILAERGLIDDALLGRALAAAPGTLFTLDGGTPA